MVKISFPMNFKEYIETNKEEIKKEWFEWLIAHYPESSKKYLLQIDKPFTNPVGYTLYKNLENLVILIAKEDFESHQFQNSLEEILKIRAVQNLSYWQSANIFQFLWQKYNNTKENLDGIESYRKDVEFYLKMSEKAFEIFIQIRENIARIQRDEIRNRYGKFLDKLNERYKLMDYFDDKSLTNKIKE